MKTHDNCSLKLLFQVASKSACHLNDPRCQSNMHAEIKLAKMAQVFKDCKRQGILMRLPVHFGGLTDIQTFGTFLHSWVPKWFLLLVTTVDFYRYMYW